MYISTCECEFSLSLMQALVKTQIMADRGDTEKEGCNWAYKSASASGLKIQLGFKISADPNWSC